MHASPLILLFSENTDRSVTTSLESRLILGIQEVVLKKIPENSGEIQDDRYLPVF